MTVVDSKNKRGICILAASIALGCLLGSLQPAAAAQPEYRPIADAIPVKLPARGPVSREELEAFMDGVLAVQFKRDHIAGAAVAVVKDGELYFAKGYGYENVEKRTAVDPHRTLFRAGSVSKLFTWTAVMQLVEQGKLDLDQDVNAYLEDFQIPATFSEPITLRNLMTHTPGLEDGGIGYLFSKNEKDLIELGSWLAMHMPARVRPPTTDFTSGENASYSNWGSALAGHIVATVAGVPFDVYVEQNIFGPLGMAHSTFREPLPPQLAERLSRSYAFDRGVFEDRGFEFAHNVGPAGSLSTTATDMAKFALAHLQGGATDTGRILEPQTARQMHARALSLHPNMNGVTLGFVETWVNGRRVLGHNGDTIYFHSDLILVPEVQLALFSSYNTLGAGAAAGELQAAFLRHYFPARLPEVEPPPDALRRNVRYEGTYRTLRRSYTKVEKAFAAVMGDLSVTALADGTLLIANPVDRKPARWIEVGEGVFRKSDEALYLAFKGDHDGRATNLIASFPAPVNAERISGFQSASLHGVFIVMAVGLFISMLVSAIRRRHEDRTGPASVRWARPSLALAGVLLIAFLIGTVAALSGGIEALIFAWPASFHVALALPLLALLPTGAAVFHSVVLWRRRVWSTGARLHYTATTIAAVVFTLILHYWNLLGYRFG